MKPVEESTKTWKHLQKEIEAKLSDIGLKGKFELSFHQNQFNGPVSYQEFVFEPKRLLEKQGDNLGTTLKNSAEEINKHRADWSFLVPGYYMLVMELEEEDFGIYVHQEKSAQGMTLEQVTEMERILPVGQYEIELEQIKLNALFHPMEARHNALDIYQLEREKITGSLVMLAGYLQREINKVLGEIDKVKGKEQ